MGCPESLLCGPSLGATLREASMIEARAIMRSELKTLSDNILGGIREIVREEDGRHHGEPRNCDAYGNAKEARRAFDDMCNRRECRSCGLHRVGGRPSDCIVAWLYQPHGGVDGNARNEKEK